MDEYKITLINIHAWNVFVFIFEGVENMNMLLEKCQLPRPPYQPCASVSQLPQALFFLEKHPAPRIF